MHYCSIFEEVDPVKKPLCRRWLYDQDSYCKNVAGQRQERPRAEEKRACILNLDPLNNRMFVLLLELAEMVHCRHRHRSQVQILQGTAQHWHAELKERSQRSNPQVPRSLDLRSESPPIRPPQATPPVPHHLTRSVTARMDGREHGEAHHAPRNPPSFEPMESRMRVFDAIVGIVRKPLIDSTPKTGYIYMFTRQESPGYVKIGYTYDVDQRLRQWGTGCRFEPVLQYQSSLIPNIYRVERLIFAELAEHRRKDMRCINEGICGRTHIEWFQVGVTTAKCAIKRWADWSLKEPYAGSGTLKPDWVKYSEEWRERSRQDNSFPTGCPFGADLPTALVVPEDCRICYDRLPVSDQHLDSCPQCHNSCWHTSCIEKRLHRTPTCPLCRVGDEWFNRGRSRVSKGRMRMAKKYSGWCYFLLLVLCCVWRALPGVLLHQTNIVVSCPSYESHFPVLRHPVTGPEAQYA